MIDFFWIVLLAGFFFLLGVLISVSKKLQYYFKFTVFGIMCAFATSWPVLFMFLRPFNWKNALIPAWQIKKGMRLCGAKFIIRGKENIVKDQAAVIIINHQSVLDLVVLAEIWPVIDNCVVVSKREILYFTGIFGLASYLWGTIFINRNEKKTSVNVLNTTGEIIKKRKAKLLMFPEGTRHSDSKLKQFKKGAFNVAISSQAPIQPIVVSKYYFIDHEKKTFDSGTSYITILPAISTEGMTKSDLDTLMNKSYEIMNREFQKSTEEVLSKVNNREKIE